MALQTQTHSVADIASQRKKKEQKNSRIMQQFQMEIYQKLEDRFHGATTQGHSRTESRGSEQWSEQWRAAQELNEREYFQRYDDDDVILKISDSRNKPHQTDDKENVLLIPININRSGEPSFGKPISSRNSTDNSNGNEISLPRLEIKEKRSREGTSKINSKSIGERFIEKSNLSEAPVGRRKEVGDSTIEGLLMGDLNSTWTPRDLSLTLCIHSAMTDTEVERSCLIEKVYPTLKDWARARGLSLKVIDSQWGMRDSALDCAELSHLTAASVMGENGRQNTFVVSMIAQKYGEPMLPLTISRNDFHAIRDAIERLSGPTEPVESQSIIETDDQPRSRRTSQHRVSLDDRRMRERRVSRYRKPSLGLQMVKLSEQRARRVSKVSNKSDLLREEEEGRSTGIQGREKGREGSRGQASSSLSTAKTPSTAVEGAGAVKDPVHLLTSWYRLDENSDPPVYRLQDISRHYPDIWSKAASERAATRSQWRGVARKLIRLLQDGAKEAQLDPAAFHKLTMSAAEMELDELFPEGDDSSVGGYLWLRRELDSSLLELSQELCRDYLDILPLQQVLDDTAQNRLQLFTRGKLQQHFGKEVQNHYDVEWLPEGIDPTTSRTHRLYVERMSDDVTQTITKHMTNELMKEQETRSCELMQLAAEVHQHVSAVHKFSQDFTGREMELHAILRHIERSRDNGSSGPLLLLGTGPGCGLTSLLATAARVTSQRHRKAMILTRFIDLTVQSTDLLFLLRSLCLQLEYIQQGLGGGSADLGQVPNSFNGVMNYFARCLERASGQNRIIIFVDSIHKLSDNYDAKQLYWLPRALPSNVSIIISSIENDATIKAFRNSPQSATASEAFSPCSQTVTSSAEKEEYEQILRVDSLSSRHWEIVLNKTLRDNSRKLTRIQRDQLLQACDRTKSSLVASLLIRDALHWPSYEPVNSSSLYTTVRSLIGHRFSKAERTHGEALVRRALGYITAACVAVRPPEEDTSRGGAQRSKGLKTTTSSKMDDSRLGRIVAPEERLGLTFNELEDVLSLDEAVLGELSEYGKLPLKRVPSMMLARVLFDIKPYLRTALDVRNYNGVWRYLLISKRIGQDNHVIGGEGQLITWAHSEILLAASERYLDQRDKANSYHKILAEYFMDFNPKSEIRDRSAEHRASRHLMSQSFYWNVAIYDISLVGSRMQNEDQINYAGVEGSYNETKEQKLVPADVNTSKNQIEDGKLVTQRVYNLRALIQLPAQLALQHKLDQLKSVCLCNLEFLLAKLTATSVDVLIKDIQLGLKIDPRDGDLNLLLSFIEEAREILERSPSQLASQVMGRLRKCLDEDVPLAPRDPLKYPCMKLLIRQIRESSIPILVPSSTCLLEPSGLYCDVFSNHTDSITAIASSTDASIAVTTSLDDTMKVWCLTSGRVLKTIGGVGRKVLEIQFCLGKSCAVTSESDCIRIWDLERNICQQRISGISDSAIISVAENGQYLVALFHGSFVLKIWDLGDPDCSQPFIAEQLEDLKMAEIGLLSKNSFNSLLLLGAKNFNRALIYNYRKKEIVRRLRVKQMEGSIKALAASVDYLIMAVRYPCAKSFDAVNIELFDGRRFDFVRALKGCVGNDVIHSLHVNERGSHTLAFCCSPTSGVSYVASWGLDTSEHKHIAKHRGTSLLGSVEDLRYILTASNMEKYFRRWDAKVALTKKSPKEKPTSGILQIFSIKNFPRYVATRSTNERELSIWNLTKNKMKGQLIYTERTLSQPGDVVLVYNTLVVVLSRKVFDVVGDRQLVVYKTLKQFSIAERKFISILENCAIIQSQPDEYRLINENLLLGLSENRSHAIIYGIETGQPLHHLRHNFRDVLHSRQEFDFAGISRRTTSRLELGTPVDTASMLTPWARRLETQTAKGRRQKAQLEEERRAEKELRLERSNAVEKYLLSANHTTMVASYFAHHLCVFDVQQQKLVTTLESSNSILHLYAAALTSDGKYLAHSVFDTVEKIGYITVWNCRTGKILRRLRNQTSIAAVAISDDARKVVFGKQPTGNSNSTQTSSASLCIWNVSQNGENSCVFKQLHDHRYLDFTSNSSIRLFNNASRAVIYGSDLSLWDVNEGILLSIFTPDGFISDHTVALDDQNIVLAFSEFTYPVSLKSVEPKKIEAELIGRNEFGEEESDTDESEKDDNESDAEIEN